MSTIVATHENIFLEIRGKGKEEMVKY